MFIFSNTFDNVIFQNFFLLYVKGQGQMVSNMLISIGNYVWKTRTHGLKELGQKSGLMQLVPELVNTDYPC